MMYFCKFIRIFCNFSQILWRPGASANGLPLRPTPESVPSETKSWQPRLMIVCENWNMKNQFWQDKNLKVALPFLDSNLSLFNGILSIYEKIGNYNQWQNIPWNFHRRKVVLWNYYLILQMLLIPIAHNLISSTIIGLAFNYSFLLNTQGVWSSSLVEHKLLNQYFDPQHFRVAHLEFRFTFLIFVLNRCWANVSHGLLIIF